MNKVTLTLQNAHRNAPNGQTGTGGEMELVDKVFYAMRDELINKGIELYYDDATVINGAKTDYFIALHFDGSTNPAYHGGFVDDSPYDQVAAQSWKLAQMVADRYFGPMGIEFVPGHRTVKSTYYYAFNQTGANTKQFLIELGTLTNPDDRAKCQDFNKIARLLNEGIFAYLSQYDDNYKAYLAGQTTISNQAEIDILKKEVQAQKESYSKLQEETKRALSVKDRECQDKIQALKAKIKSFIESA